ncbi:MAG: EthD family reductase, partial [Betaproteobacteria bacterium]|nr:EthD family reductase [Betaproteobacteria bacterium]
MAKLIALYKTPTDKAAFDDYYFGKHVPLAKT